MVDIGSAASPFPHPAEAIRLACGERAASDEGHALAKALIDIVPLRNNGLLCGPLDGGTRLHLLVEGWAYRAQGLPDGTRQITDILVPGNICDGVPLASNEEIRASGPARVAVLRRGMDGYDMQALAARHDREMVRDIRRLRAHLTSLGRRDARSRLAYCLADLHSRLKAAGLAKGDSFFCPLTQEQLSDLLGLTAVHVNRVVQGLRREAVLMFGGRQVTILDRKRLHAIAGWQPDEDGPLPLSLAPRKSRGVS